MTKRILLIAALGLCCACAPRTDCLKYVDTMVGLRVIHDVSREILPVRKRYPVSVEIVAE